MIKKMYQKQTDDVSKKTQQIEMIIQKNLSKPNATSSPSQHDDVTGEKQQNEMMIKTCFNNKQKTNRWSTSSPSWHDDVTEERNNK